jgi:trimeric autotransporter adhesin
MASHRFTGAALDVYQSDLITVTGTWTAGDTAVVTIGTRSITVTIGATVTVTAVATAIAEAINGDSITGNATRSASGADIPEFQEVTATSDVGVVTVTANTAGKPFTLLASETTASTGTAVRSASVACTGSEWWDNTDNWDSGALPADGDTVYFDHSEVSVRYGLDQSAIELAAMHVDLSYTGEIGLPEINAEGGYYEYRSQYLTIGPLILKVGAGTGNGSGRLKINSGADVCSVTVFNTGNSADELPAFIWKGTDASNTLNIVNGSVGVAIFGGETATIATVTKTGGDLVTGAGVTLSGALVQNGGSWVFNSLIDGSLTQNAGAAVINGTGNVDQLTIRGGSVSYLTSGTLGGNTVVSGDGILDFSGATTSVTVSNRINVESLTARVFDPLKRTGNVVIDLTGGSTLANIDLGTELSVTRGTVA